MAGGRTAEQEAIATLKEAIAELRRLREDDRKENSQRFLQIVGLFLVAAAGLVLRDVFEGTPAPPPAVVGGVIDLVRAVIGG
jgi:hypothetical protein